MRIPAAIRGVFWASAHSFERPDPPWGPRRRAGGRLRRDYLARCHMDSAFVPVEVVGFVYRSSSPVSEVMMRFCSPPMRFGYELPSMRPKGAAMYDAKGRFTFMIMRSDLPKFVSNNRAQATAEEGKAVAQGMIVFYGTYTVNDGVLITRIEGSSYPNIIGGEQKRIIISL